MYKDYIICGGGMAGLSLAYQLCLDPFFKDKSIVIIDPEEKNKNDRTWGFWQKEQSFYEPILTKKWDNVIFKNPKGEVLELNLKPYSYKVLRGIDFYQFTQEKIRQNPNVSWKRTKVTRHEEKQGYVHVYCEDGTELKGEYIFDSTLKPDLNKKGYYHFLQHFKGAVIETKTPRFNPELATIMDFSIPDYGGLCNFIYVLPFSQTKALIEYTVFSENLLSEKEYNEHLYSDYLDTHLGKNSYTILEEEFGVIPMSDTPLKAKKGKRIYYIGISGGNTNAATGYTFASSQKHINTLIRTLKEGDEFSEKGLWQRRHEFYSTILLDVLKHDRIPLGDAFYQLFFKNKASDVFEFLDGTSNFFTELKIMWSTEKRHFLAAVFQSIITRMLKR